MTNAACPNPSFLSLLCLSNCSKQSKANSLVCDLTALQFLQALSIPTQTSGKSNAAESVRDQGAREHALKHPTIFRMNVPGWGCFRDM